MNGFTRRRFAALIALLFLVVIPFGLASACGGAAMPPHAAIGSASASASTPLFTQSSGASPIHETWKTGACEVEMREALGATYRFDAELSEQVGQSLREAANRCLKGAQATQGTIYVQAKVGANGAVSEVVVSPGGAVSTEVAQCLTSSFAQARLPAPEEPDSVLLLFVVSACPVP